MEYVLTCITAWPPVKTDTPYTDISSHVLQCSSLGCTYLNKDMTRVPNQIYIYTGLII